MTGEVCLNLSLPAAPEEEHWEKIITALMKKGFVFTHLGSLGTAGVSMTMLTRELSLGLPAFALAPGGGSATGRRSPQMVTISISGESIGSLVKGAVVLSLSFIDSVSTMEKETRLYLSACWRDQLVWLLDPIIRELNPPIGCCAPIVSDAGSEDEYADELGWLRPGAPEQVISRLTELTYLNKKAADQLDRDKLESLPSGRLINFPLGGVLIDLIGAAFTPREDDAEDALTAVSTYLRLPRVIHP